MKAQWNNQIIAEAPKNELILIEGNWYFPPEAIKREFFTSSDTHTTCFWKGEASYYTLVVDGQRNEDAAWYYPTPMDGATKRVKKDFRNYVAFWHGVTVGE